MRKVLWSVAWGGLSIAAVATMWAGWTTLAMSLTEADIQPRVDWFLPQEHNGLKLDRAKISLIGSTMRVDAGMSGTQVAQKLSAEVVAIGSLSYNPERASFFFEPASVDVRKPALSDNPTISRLGEAAARIGSRTVPGQGSVEDSAGVLIERIANFAIRRAPIYKLEDDATFLILHPMLYAIEVRGSKLVAEFKLWRPTIGVALAMLGMGCALGLMIVLLLRPTGGAPRPEIRKEPGSLPSFLRRAGRR